jgi:uracil-DNA glycosylase
VRTELPKRDEEMKTILFVGTNPSNASPYESVAFHWYTKSSQRLSKWMEGIDGCKMYINVLNKKTEGNRPPKKSEIDLGQLKEQLNIAGADRVVALGHIASKSLRAIGVAHLQMPHPSGKNRLLNSRTFEAQKIKELADYCAS